MNVAGRFNTAAFDDEMQEALEDKDFDAILNLAGRGVDVDARDGVGNTALMFAVNLKRRDMMEKLLAAGADPGKRNNAGFSVLHRAIEGVFAEGVELLLARGATLDPAVYKQNVMAADRARIVLAPLFVGAGAADSEAVDFAGHTALMLAAMTGKAEVAEKMLALGAALEGADNNGNTALALAAAAGHVPLVLLLAEAGADLDALNNKGETPQQAAENAKKPEAAATLENIRRQRAAAARAEKEAARAALQARRSARTDALRRVAPKLRPRP